MRKRRVWGWSLLPLCLLIGAGIYLLKGNPQQVLQQVHRQSPPPQPARTTPAAPQPAAISAGTLIAADTAHHAIYSTPQWSPDGHAIAYVRSINDDKLKQNGDLYLAEFTDGAWTHRLLAKGADWPRWSPNGRKLAFNQGGLAVMDLRSGNIRKLIADNPTDGEEFTYHHPDSWSPNSRYLFFHTDCWEWAEYGIYDFTTDNTAVKVSETARGVWLPGNRLLLNINPDVYEEGTAYLAIYDVGKRQMKTLAEKSDAIPHFVSPDGTTAYLQEDDTIIKLDLVTGKRTKTKNISAGHMAWRPGGAQFAYTDWHEHGNMPNRPVSLCIGSFEKTKGRVVASPVMSSYLLHDEQYRFSWSPDGTWIAYTTDKGDIKIIQP